MRSRKGSKEICNIPVFHDDQHGTAIVALAGIINALKIVGKKFPDIKVVISGAGASGTSVTKLLMRYGTRNIIACDRKGALCHGETTDPVKSRLAAITIRTGKRAALQMS